MAEAFLKEIYKDAKLIYDARQIVEYAKVHDEHHAAMKFNEIQPRLIEICQRYAAWDKKGGEELASHIVHIKEIRNDLILIGDIIENKVIPLLEKSMRYYGAVQTENEEGDFLFETAVSGFLTLKDLRQNVYVHSTVCPMWEAKKIAEYIFDPRKKAYSILGCGLGYLAYQLYVISDGAAAIRIFERDARVIEYAGSYGVLDWIPADKVEVIIDTDPLAFLNSALEADTGFYILAAEIERESMDIKPLLWELYAQWSTGYKFKRNEEINYWSNLRSGCRLITEFDSSSLEKDFIVVAAGPSLDDNMEFLRENQGKKTIIAVGTVFKKLLNHNIIPDMVAILDAQERTYEQIEGFEEQKIPMLLGMTAYWKFAAAYKGEKYLIPLRGMESLDNITEKYDDVWAGGGTVTSLAIEAAIRFKAEKVFLVGVDLAYPGGMSHAAETMDRGGKSQEGLLPVEGQNGTTVYTTVVFNSYRREIEAKIAETPWILYYNMSAVGAKIAGTQYAAGNVE
ncbi:MAG: DUF115 domain-containing protein [Lachnospiraceae bacterium]|nr:DUF115 domain-containing protein [Lachnospiraceae bacterium]